MKTIYAYLAAAAFVISLLVGVSSPAKIPEQVSYELFEKQGNRLLVISEDWCQNCRKMSPDLAELKKQGYNVHKYTKMKWHLAKGKPEKLPELFKPDPKTGEVKYSVPVVLFVKADKEKNEVVHWAQGSKDLTYLKRYLTK